MTGNSKLNAPASTAPGTSQTSPGKRRVEVVILGAGDETLIEVGPALGDEYRTYSVDTASDIAGLSAGGAWIGLYDATTQAAGRSAFAQMDPQYARHPWIVLCTDEDKATWRDVLSRGDACAVIARGEISTVTLTAALLKASQRLTGTASEPPASSGFTPPKPVILVAGAIALAVVAAAVWWLTHSHARAPGAARAAAHKLVITGGGSAVQGPATAMPAATAPPSVEDLLSMARVAFRDPNAQLPKADAPLQGTSALELYGAVLLQQPKNGEALDGVRRLQSVARLRVQNALAAGDADTAERLLAILQRADFNPEEMRTLEAAVAAARPKQLAAQARGALAAGNVPLARQYVEQLAGLTGERAPVPELRKELEARKLDGELSADGEQVRSAITSGSLLEPEADNARMHVLAMRELNRAAAQTTAAEHELLQALLRRVQGQVARQDFDHAQQTLTAAQDFGSKAELAETRAALDAAVAAKRAADTAAIAAAASHASAPTPAPVAAAPILSPKPTRPLQVDFPTAAEAQNIQGYVVIEFMLNPNGSTSGATVIEAAPRGTFDSAALAAVKRATFSTKDLADPRKPQRARFKINFNLADSASPAQAPVVSRPTPVTSPAASASGPVARPQVLSPKPTHPLEVEYPKLALELNRTGYVVVEFMLNPDGTPGSPTVIESAPAKVFDNAALDAVKRARFVTTDLADPSRPQRARVKINFRGS